MPIEIIRTVNIVLNLLDLNDLDAIRIFSLEAVDMILNFIISSKVKQNKKKILKLLACHFLFEELPKRLLWNRCNNI